LLLFAEAENNNHINNNGTDRVEPCPYKRNGKQQQRGQGQALSLRQQQAPFLILAFSAAPSYRTEVLLDRFVPAP
jgi:hypothetical protein